MDSSFIMECVEVAVNIAQTVSPQTSLPVLLAALTFTFLRDLVYLVLKNVSPVLTKNVLFAKVVTILLQMEPVFLIVNYLAKRAKMVVLKNVNPASSALFSKTVNVYLI